ncbi:MAG: phosphoribosyltransferase family protein [Paracoccaceae bacterium]|jgi:putative phosphoribosyl transferase|nr:phosphoribosyltransferase family protein [Paracoccaceae bacterium]
MRFADRTEAGQQLAKMLAGRTLERPVVLALPRGGVPVALEVARALNAPLDLVMVRKIGLPGQPEVALAAVVDGGRPDLEVNEGIALQAGLNRLDIVKLAEPELAEIARRRALYLAGRKSVPLAGRTVIMVDDGIATGATVRVALRAVRRQGPARLILAVPVAPAAELDMLRDLVDEVICLHAPEAFGAVGAWYADFTQVADDDVIAMLAEAEA